MYYSIYFINFDQLFEKVNIPKDISEHLCLDTTFLSGHFPITHCSLYNKAFYLFPGKRDVSVFSKARFRRLPLKGKYVLENLSTL